MIHPGITLQSAIYDLLVADAALLDVLGAAKIYDDVPRKAKPPYISFGDATHFDWSTGTEDGTEHIISLNVWSGKQGRKQALQIAQIIENAISTPSTELIDHALINLTHESTEVSKDIKSDLFLARINLRAITEPI